MKDELVKKIMTKFVLLRVKPYSYLIDDGSEDKKSKSHKKCVIKRKLVLENYKNCLEATQLENKINHQEKYKTDIDSIKKNHEEFIRYNKLILKINLKVKKRLESERHAFTEKN